MRFAMRAAAGAALLLMGAVAGAGAQEPAPGRDALRVFLDCQTFGCDTDFFRTELAWVDWVRDREVADVHVLVTAQGTGAGGRQFDLAFLGLGVFAGQSDTAQVSVGPTATSDETRRSLLRVLSLGLVPYASETAVAERLEVRLRGEPGAAAPQAATTPADDPWDFWVFRVGTDAFLNGESQQSFHRISASLSASRVTEEWKLTFRGNGSYNQSRFELPDRTINTIRRSYSGDVLLVNSWGSHWSGGALVRLSSSTFSNYDLSARFAPAIEYNFFPYAESTRRQLTVRYSIGPSRRDYSEETVYRKLDDTFAEQELEIELGMNQPWGSINFTTQLAHYLGWEPAASVPAELRPEGERYSAGISGFTNVRLFKGLQFRVGGGYSRVNNQINLPRGEATDEQILLRLRQLETRYTYFTSMGLSYTFGSIFNNVVNPRFGSSGGGGIIIMM